MSDDLKPCRDAFEEWFANDETFQDSGIEVSLVKAKDLMWIGYIAGRDRRSGEGEEYRQFYDIFSKLDGTEYSKEQAMDTVRGYVKNYDLLKTEHTRLRSGVEQVRDEIQIGWEPGDSASKVAYRFKNIKAALTRILDEDGA